MLNGFINLDKPLNMSSARAVDVVKRILARHPADRVAIAQDLMHIEGDSAQRQRRSQNDSKFKIGHAGTLDPLATGVLVLAVGKATKLIHHVQDAPKEYEFTVTWGEERETDDAEGEVVATSDKRPTLADIEAILPEFTGEIMQAPPAFSAIKMDGKRAYAMARAGEVVVMRERAVHVHGLQITEAREQNLSSGICTLSSTTFHTKCGKGTYIRSLARDFGRKLEVYGYVSMLRRTAIGKFCADDAISLEKLEKLVHKGDLGFVQPMGVVLDDILASA